MAKDFKTSMVVAQGKLAYGTTQVDTGAGTAKVIVYDGAKPANPDTATGANKLIEFDLPDPSWGAPTPGTGEAVASLQGAPISANGLLGGTATWARVVNKDGTAVFDGTVGTTDADLIISDTTIVQNDPYQLQSWTRRQAI